MITRKVTETFSVSVPCTALQWKKWTTEIEFDLEEYDWVQSYPDAEYDIGQLCFPAMPSYRVAKTLEDTVLSLLGSPNE
jgi:hypothetical protein